MRQYNYYHNSKKKNTTLVYLKNNNFLFFRKFETASSFIIALKKEEKERKEKRKKKKSHTIVYSTCTNESTQCPKGLELYIVAANVERWLQADIYIHGNALVWSEKTTSVCWPSNNNRLQGKVVTSWRRPKKIGNYPLRLKWTHAGCFSSHKHTHAHAHKQAHNTHFGITPCRDSPSKVGQSILHKSKKKEKKKKTCFFFWTGTKLVRGNKNANSSGKLLTTAQRE